MAIPRTAHGLYGAAYAEACQGLAARLAATAGLRAGQTVVDVGFGFGEQVLFFAALYPGVDLHGVNIPARLIATAEAQHRAITFPVADAVDLPFEDESVDQVLALESAIHFRTREDFFVEAYRILRPGGRLTLADFTLDDRRVTLPRYAWWHNGVYRTLRRLASRFQVGTVENEVPAQNMYGLEEYRARFGGAGFVDIVLEDISSQVLIWPNARFAAGGLAARWMALPRPWLHRSAQPGIIVPGDDRGNLCDRNRPEDRPDPRPRGKARPLATTRCRRDKARCATAWQRL